MQQFVELSEVTRPDADATSVTDEEDARAVRQPTRCPAQRLRAWMLGGVVAALAITIFVIVIASHRHAHGLLPPRTDQDLPALFDRYWATELQYQPELATMSGIPGHNARWSNLTEDSIAALHRERQAILAELLAIQERVNQVQPALASSMHVLAERLRLDIELHAFQAYLMPVDQMDGLHLFLPQLAASTAFVTASDYEDYLARLASLPALMEQIIGLLRAGVQRAITPPQVRAFVGMCAVAK